MSSSVPEGAPESCPGTESSDAGKAAPCAGCPNQSICASGEARPKGPDPALVDIQDRMSGIGEKILVLSGKGGVGKSTFAATLARALSAGEEGKSVAVLDVDICGPSQPRILGAEGEEVHQSASGWSPVFVSENLCLMSIGFLLPSKNEAVIWRGPRKNAMIKQFLKDVDWGEQDFLVVDTPPGTSDEHMSLVQLLCAATKVKGAVLLTTPQEVSLLDVRKEADFCRRVGLPVLGVVENMAGFVCQHCQCTTELFPRSTGGAERMCSELGLRFLGHIPGDPKLAAACDQGEDFFKAAPNSPAAKAYLNIAAQITTAATP